MPREMCYRCFWPKALCWCATLRPMPTRSRLVFLMHPKEFKQEKAGTGRLTHLCLPNSELHMGMEFDGHERIEALLADPARYSVLLYPGPTALNLSEPGSLALLPADRDLNVFLLDATWSGARKMLRKSRGLQAIPRIMFRASAPSRFVIKQQPQAGCLSTLESVHELLCLLGDAGREDYADRGQLLAIFQRMQEFQIACAADPTRTGYRRRPYSAPAERTASRGRSRRRRRYLKASGEQSAVNGEQ